MATDVVRVVRTDAELASALRICVTRLSRRLRQERGVADHLSPNQLGVLGTLMREGSLAIGGLASSERVRPPSMTRTVGSLVDIGLVQRESSPTDGRQVLVGLTEAGRAVVLESRRRKEAWLNRVLADLTADQRSLLRAALPVLEGLSRA
jgi:DNA-binding MarR family transcriptional regulator